jgi:GTP-binding protein
MPGYGYASRGGEELKTWRKMIEGYLSQRPQLAGLVLLMDMARDWETDEEVLAQYMMKHDLPVMIGLTKCDKFSKNDIKKAIERIKKQSRVDDVFAVSSKTQEGCAELEEFVYRSWIKK